MVDPDSPDTTGTAFRRAPGRSANAVAFVNEYMDIVFVDGLTIPTIIGIDHAELHDQQPVRMHLAIGFPEILACKTDRIVDTVNYAQVRDALHRLLSVHRVQLLEALAEMIAQLMISRFGAHWVRVSLAKPAKFDNVDSVGVVIERRRPAGCAGQASDASPCLMST
jgi:7,8-dihydroneopterin aldolase/epimerase/oxygenase